MKGRLLTGWAPILLALSRAAAGQTAQPPAAPLVLTLESALSLALSGNRQVASEELEVAKAADRLAASKADRLPSLNFDMTVGRLLQPVEIQVPEAAMGTYPGIGPIPGADSTVTSEPRTATIGVASLQQPLSQLYKIGLNVKARETLVELEKERLRGNRQSIAREVRRAYYAILSAQTSLESATQTLAQAREVERVVAERARQQIALAPEQLRARSRVAQAEYDVASLENSIATTKEQLNVLLGRDLGPEFHVVSPPPPARPAKDLQAGRQQASLRSPDVLQAHLKTSVADLETKIAEAEFLPDISATLLYAKPWNVDFQPKSVFTAGLLVRWKVFDGGRRHKELAEKRKASEQARLAAAEAEQTAQVQAAREWRRIEEAENLVRSSALAMEAAREELRIARDRSGLQAALLQDLLSAQASLADANHRYTEALATFWTARADYESSIGEDL